ncbi:MAG: hypothetical protein M3492_10435 [Actinomycetota bacterium]|nr:hypothetical protein [Actinomycetota bacterium]
MLDAGLDLVDGLRDPGHPFLEQLTVPGEDLAGPIRVSGAQDLADIGQRQIDCS